MLRKTYRFRLNTLVVIPLLCMAAIIPRLYYLQVYRYDYYVKKADAQHNKTLEVIPCRGKILDAGHHELAGSTMLQSAYVAPSLIEGPEAASDLARHISHVLGIDYDTLYKKFTGNREVPIGRKLDAAHVAALRDAISTCNLELQASTKAKGSAKVKSVYVPPTAIYCMPEGKRFYPRGELASHIIGYTELNDTGDNKGRAGVELAWDQELRGQLRKCRARTNAAMTTLEPIDPEVLNSSYGNNIVLTIDEAIQHCAETVLKRSVLENNADSGVAMVYGVKTGEVLAMANCPSFSLNDMRNASDFQRRNRCITDAIEPGSVMKTFTFSTLFDEGRITPEDMIDCEGGTWNMGFRTIKDTHSIGVVPAKTVFAESSNVGSVKAAQRMSPAMFYRHLVNFGFGEKTGIDLPGETTGFMRPLKQWSGLSMSSIPIGYEIQVSAIQVVAAVGSIANKGIYMQPHIVKEIQDYRGETVRRIDPKPLRRTLSVKACNEIIGMMEEVMVNGTGKKVQLEHYRAGGKTGTTKKIDPETGHYSTTSYIASFCGIAPLEDPEIVVYVYIDNPRGSSYYGAQVSGPPFKEIAETALKALKVPVRTPEVQPATSLDVAKGEKKKGKSEKKQQAEEQQLAAEQATPTPKPTSGLLAALVPSHDEVSSDSMPNLEGLTMREAQVKLSALGLPFHFEGSGVVIEQTPHAYETLEKGQQVVVRFGPSKRLMERIAETVRRTEEPVTEEPSAPQPYSVETIKLEKPGRPAAVVTLEQGATPPTPPPAQKTPTVAQSTPVPDVDSYAKRAPNKALGKRVWTAWEKEKEKRKAQKAAAAKATPAATSTPPASGADPKQTASEQAKTSVKPNASQGAKAAQSVAAEQPAKPEATARASKGSTAQAAKETAAKESVQPEESVQAEQSKPDSAEDAFQVPTQQETPKATVKATVTKESAQGEASEPAPKQSVVPQEPAKPQAEPAVSEADSVPEGLPRPAKMPVMKPTATPKAAAQATPEPVPEEASAAKKSEGPEKTPAAPEESSSEESNRDAGLKPLEAEPRSKEPVKAARRVSETDEESVEEPVVSVPASKRSVKPTPAAGSDKRKADKTPSSRDRNIESAYDLPGRK